MVDLYLSEDDSKIGSITEEDLALLIDCLEEEDTEDTDYYIDRDTLAYLKEEGASAELVAMLENALSDRAAIDVYYLTEDATAPEE
ncbi:MAG: galactosyldiacylglycerol synthase [Armatimonadetes bacterium]|nr:galactosyldiacylglycerol synthase [Armatimonadota bacterium]